MCCLPFKPVSVSGLVCLFSCLLAVNRTIQNLQLQVAAQAQTIASLRSNVTEVVGNVIVVVIVFIVSGCSVLHSNGCCASRDHSDDRDQFRHQSCRHYQCCVCVRRHQLELRSTNPRHISRLRQCVLHRLGCLQRCCGYRLARKSFRKPISVRKRRVGRPARLCRSWYHHPAAIWRMDRAQNHHFGLFRSDHHQRCENLGVDRACWALTIDMYTLFLTSLRMNKPRR